MTRNPIQQLFGQTAVYGMGIVLPRVLNYLLLTPFYTRIFPTDQYGIITELYAYVVFLQVVLTYGMETGFFRYASHSREKESVFTSVISSVFVTSLLFVLLVIAFIHPISKTLGYENFPQYIKWLSFIVAIDAFTAIPFAQIRLLNKPLRYALVRIGEVSMNIVLNGFFLYIAPKFYTEVGWIARIYDPQIGVGYVLISNLVASVFKLILLTPEIISAFRGKIDPVLLRTILKYSYPILIGGLAGAVNEMLDRVLLKHLLDPSENPMAQLGIYGANCKMAVLMTLYVQMFKYAAEPFFFSKSKEKDAKKLYADVMKFFLIPGFIVFLVVMLYINYFILFIGSDFREGSSIVPVILLSNLIMGIFYNLSIWYKLTDKTMIGATLVIMGAVLTILINVIFIPRFGYLASAWGHIVCYSAMVIASWAWSKKHYPIPYDIKKILFYFVVVLAFFFVDRLLVKNDISWAGIMKPILILAAVAIFYAGEKKTFQKYKSAPVNNG